MALSEAQLRRAGISWVQAGAASLQAMQDFPGEIRFNEDRTAHVVPGLSGVVTAVPAQLGQQVRAGEVLAVLASKGLAELRSELLGAKRRLEAAQAHHEREQRLWQDRIAAEQDVQQARTALQEAQIAVDAVRQKLDALGAAPTSSTLNRLEIRAPFAGTIVEKHLSRGEAVQEDASIFTLSDLRTVWAELAVAPKDLALVRVGQQVMVSSSALEEKVPGRIAYVGALIGEQTRTARARVTLDNPKGAWRPGLFVTVSVQGEQQTVSVAVPAESVQTVDQQRVVFKAVPGGLRAVPVQTGRTDGRMVEILQGVAAGESVASGQVFVLKSELGKASAEHQH